MARLIYDESGVAPAALGVGAFRQLITSNIRSSSLASVANTTTLTPRHVCSVEDNRRLRWFSLYAV